MKYNPLLTTREGVLSERFHVERGMLKYEIPLIRRYETCQKCHNVLIKIDAKGFKGRHQNINAGFYCRNCEVFYMNIELKDKIEWIEFVNRKPSQNTKTQESQS